ncbi:MAG: PEP-CTERM sorting domain-containing protein [Planctomycetaceae bacterium]|jgi:hypothetical protein|nr:PEP-CTERM sorting domain-containing protein [Planctomycetaceae bacterium]
MDTITNKPNVSLLRGSSFTAAALVLCAFCLPGSVPVNAGYDGGSLVDNWINVSNYMQTLEGQDAVYTIDDGERSVNYEFKYDDKYIYGKATSAMAYLPRYLQEYNRLISEGYTHEQIIDPLSDAGKQWRDADRLVSGVIAMALDTNQAAVLVQHGGDKVYSGLSTGFDYDDINPWNAGDAYYVADMSNEDAASNMGPWGNHSRELDGIITDDTATSSWDVWNNAAEDGSNSFFDGSMQSYYDFERNNAFYFAIDRSLLGGSTFYLIASILQQQESEHYLTFGDEITITVTGVASPEPATLLLFGLGVSALAVARRRK